jgi:hypothetical protein
MKIYYKTREDTVDTTEEVSLEIDSLEEIQNIISYLRDVESVLSRS